MASELAKSIDAACINALVDRRTVNRTWERIDELLAPVRKFIVLVASKPCDCESMKQDARDLLASLDPNPPAK